MPTYPPSPGTDEHEPTAGSYFVATYPPFSCWTAAENAAFLTHLSRPAAAAADAPLSLYAHVPFCIQRCDFCYYLSYDDRMVDRDAYVDALLKEFSLYAATAALKSRRLTTAYLGGGTPMALSVRQIERLMSGLQSIVSWDDVTETTFECAPKVVTEPKLRAMRAAGVNRVSLGVQQMNDDVLRRSGRIHLVRDVLTAYETIQNCGFAQVNIDLMVGLCGETDDSFLASLEEVVTLAPDSVTIYQTEVPLNTPLFRALHDGMLPEPLATWDEKRRRLRRAFARLEEAGYTLRSAYTAVRDPGRHSFDYQDAQYRGSDLLGIGASSFSYLGGIHHQNVAALDGYLARISEGQLPSLRSHLLTPTERFLREFMLQLKLGRVRTDDLLDRYGVNATRELAEPLARCVDRGWLDVTSRGIEVTREGLLRVDRLIPSFYLPEHENLRYS